MLGIRRSVAVPGLGGGSLGSGEPLAPHPVEPGVGCPCLYPRLCAGACGEGACHPSESVGVAVGVGVRRPVAGEHDGGAHVGGRAAGGVGVVGVCGGEDGRGGALSLMLRVRHVRCGEAAQSVIGPCRGLRGRRGDGRQSPRGVVGQGGDQAAGKGGLQGARAQGGGVGDLLQGQLPGRRAEDGGYGGVDGGLRRVPRLNLGHGQAAGVRPQPHAARGAVEDGFQGISPAVVAQVSERAAGGGGASPPRPGQRRGDYGVVAARTAYGEHAVGVLPRHRAGEAALTGLDGHGDDVALEHGGTAGVGGEVAGVAPLRPQAACRDGVGLHEDLAGRRADVGRIVVFRHGDGDEAVGRAPAFAVEELHGAFPHGKHPHGGEAVGGQLDTPVPAVLIAAPVEQVHQCRRRPRSAPWRSCRREGCRRTPR